MKFSKRVMEDVASLLFPRPVTDSWESKLAYQLSHSLCCFVCYSVLCLSNFAMIQ